MILKTKEAFYFLQFGIIPPASAWSAIYEHFPNAIGWDLNKKKKEKVGWNTTQKIVGFDMSQNRTRLEMCRKIMCF
jgi:hypothetical protein